ncbi:response regulator [Acidobacteriota bacterium]
MNKETMLVVEDEDIMREALVDYFSGEGHKVDTAKNGDKALEGYDLSNYNIMIVDLRLPGRDGISLLDEIRSKNPKAKVIIITAYPTLETETQARQKGAVEYLTKPFELNYLETLIRQSFDIDVVPTPPIEVPPVFEEEIIAPCIWMQAGVIKKRACTLGYQCDNMCNFHAAMINKEKFAKDERIHPYLDKLASQMGKHECRYVMSGEVSVRSCSQIYKCESCELHQTIQDEIDRQKTLKEENRKTLQEQRLSQAEKMPATGRQDH